ncbi:MAG TPA: hypothetical protein VFV65_04645 [Gemmatimonadales bacterium]|nr:hypothetical protein [Gemmatimonadales bacterium]
MWLLLVAAAGFVVPNGLFLYWLLVEFDGWGAVLANHLALAFVLDVFGTLVILSVHFARRPIGPWRWYWFAALSLLGGFVFSLPLYYWLNTRRADPAA